MLRRFRCSQPKAIRKQSIPETSRDSDSTQALNSTRQQSEPDTFNAALSTMTRQMRLPVACCSSKAARAIVPISAEPLAGSRCRHPWAKARCLSLPRPQLWRETCGGW
jgi:hypothetical protein